MQYSISALSDRIVAEKPPERSVKFGASRVRSVFVHLDVLDWLSDPSTDKKFVKKARFRIKNLLSRGYSPGDKSVTGPAKGWMRAALGGSGGFQYYMWYCDHSSKHGQQIALGAGEFAVRVIRHHDDTGIYLDPDNRDSYLPYSPSDIEGTESELFYEESQQRVAFTNTANVQTLRGYPGSGKTTALWLAANHAASKQILYITYSESLAREAREYFDAFQREDTFIDVLTFPELVRHLADDRDDAPSPLGVTDAVSALASILPARKDVVGQWDGHLHELYSELHAHGVGRALPISFNGLDGTTTNQLDATTFVNLRSEALGRSMSESAARVLDYIKEAGQIQRLFPGPSNSRKYIADINEPPTERLANVGMILVDEVQDLTLVESLLVLNIAARIGVSSGVLPRIVFAGDESQTVRPTDFKWANLKNLITEVLGELAVTDDVGLEMNLRSPLQIANFVEATRSQYALLDKDDRPSGISYTAVNEDLNGRLVYCSLRDDAEWHKLNEVFSLLPRGRMVYPGFTPPADIPQKLNGDTNIVTAAEVKGLDFDVIVLVDAGLKQTELQQLLQKNISEPYAEVFGRTMADQYRVAASRASETLVLLDRNGADHYEEIVKLCEGRKDLSVELEKVDVQQLIEIIQDDTDQESLIRSMINDAKRVIDDHPEQAMMRVRSILKQFEIFEKSNDVPSELKFEVVRLRGVCALVCILRGTEVPTATTEQLIGESKRALGQVDLGPAFESVQELASSKESWSSEAYLKLLVNGADKLTQIEKELPEVRRWHSDKLVSWLDQLLKRDCPIHEPSTKKLLIDARKLTEKLSAEFGHLHGHVDQVALRWASSLITDRRYQFALDLLEIREIRVHNLEGDCHAAMLQHRSAAESYEQAGEVAKALNSARNIPDLELAIRISTDGGLSELPTLKWIQGLETELNQYSIANHNKLTGAEKDLLKSALDPILK
jgi:hypothetical protein